MKKNRFNLVGFILDTPSVYKHKPYLDQLIKFYKELACFLRYAYFTSPEKITASAQLRVYDVINNFPDKNFHLEMYKPWKKYDIVVFQKNFNEKALRLATTLKKNGAKIIFDVNVNYYDDSSQTIRKEQHEAVIKFTEIVDCIISPSQYISNFIEERFPQKSVFCVEEHLPEFLYGIEKKYPPFNKKVKLLYSGYAVKAKEILLIEEQIKKLSKKYLIEYILIADKDPKLKIDGIKTKFIQYKRRDIHDSLLKGDIFLAPRDLKNTYNLGHSFSKIGQPMAAGIPVIASPVIAYKGSPAILIDDFGVRWSTEIERLIKDKTYYEKLSSRGVDYCQKNFSTKAIMTKYLKLFNKLIEQ